MAGKLWVMPNASGNRHVVVLAPMPLEMDAIVTAFGLTPTSDAKGAPWTGRVGSSDVTAIHIGMGPPLTRAATSRLLDETATGHVRVDHVMIAGICGGLDPNLEVGTLINPEIVIDHTSGAEYRHTPPGDAPLAGKLVTTEGVSLDRELSERFYEQGCVGVDMESSAVAEVCSPRGCAWSVYRCIGDRHFDGLLDERIIALTNQDGSGNREALGRLIASDPQLAANLERLTHDSALAARLAAEAAVRGCLALDD
ncbi:MAG: adenosylhomocysteine nucleosidase [Acidimicrobiaceae bacterium]